MLITASRTVWTVVLVLGLIALGAGVLFWTMGPEMVLLTVFFGGAGVYISFEALGHLLTDKK